MAERMDFETLVREGKNSIATDFSENSEIMLVAFGGIKGELGLPAFEFFKATSVFKVKKIYIRDLYQAWYHMGLPGLAENIGDISLIIKKIIDQENAKKVVMIGNSMGGYASLLFGFLLEADDVHSFSPQTFISRYLRILHLDFRWRKFLRNVYRYKKHEKEYLDLKKTFQSKNVKTNFHIYFAKNNFLDSLHVNRLKNYDNVKTYSYPSGGHGLIRYLRDQKILHQILCKSLGSY